MVGLTVLEVVIKKTLTLTSNSIGGIDPQTPTMPRTALGLWWYLGCPLLLTAVVLAVFVRYAGLSREIRQPTPQPRPAWLWVAPLAMLAIGLAHLTRAQTPLPSASWLAVLAMIALCVGFGEEIVFRGILPALLRRSGWGDWWVALISSTLFGLVHLGAMLRGQSFPDTMKQIVLAFFMGLALLAILRVTGSILWPMLLHALWDFSLLLRDGSAHTDSPAAANDLASLGAGAIVTASTAVLFCVAVASLVVMRRERQRPGDPASP